MRTWLNRHLQTALASLGKLAEAPLASALTVLVIAVTLALPALLQVGIKNGLAVTGGWQGARGSRVATPKRWPRCCGRARTSRP